MVGGVFGVLLNTFQSMNESFAPVVVALVCSAPLSPMVPMLMNDESPCNGAGSLALSKCVGGGTGLGDAVVDEEADDLRAVGSEFLDISGGMEPWPWDEFSFDNMTLHCCCFIISRMCCITCVWPCTRVLVALTKSDGKTSLRLRRTVAY